MKMGDVASGEKPVPDPPAGPGADRPSPDSTVVSVLLVEDNPGDARLIQYMLEDAGGRLFRLETVDRLDLALTRLEEKPFDLIISDLSLPDSAGIQTFTELRARAPQLPIIVLSGINDTAFAVEAVHEGAQDYLVKGQVDAQLLVRSLRYAIERKRLTEELARYAGELRNKNAQLEADFNMAREIQQIFLPHDYPSFPQHAPPEQSALRFSHRYLPAAAVGGDFFDVFSIASTMAGVFICDVMGHGMRAALVTAIMRGLVEELMSVAADPGKFLTEVNRSLHAILRRTREPFLATAFYLVADIASGDLRFANAGHPSPFRIRRDTREVLPLKNLDPRHGPALGLFENSLYPAGRCPLEVNDLFLLFTDGVYEVDNSRGEEYGVTRLMETVQANARVPTESLLDHLLDDVRRFAGTMEFEDDVCVVGMEVQQLGIPRTR